MYSFKAVIFDFYETLVEVDYNTPQMWQTLVDLGYQCTPSLEAMWESDAFNGTVTPSIYDIPSYDNWRRDNVRSLVRLSGVSPELVEEVVSRLLQIDTMWTVKAIDPAQEILTLLRYRGVRVGICSNWDHPIEPYLQQAKLSPFDAFSISPMVGARKPHIQMFKDICHKMSIFPQEAVYVGDNWFTDVIGALRVGMKPIWIRKGFPKSDIPHLVLDFDTLTEFYEWLQTQLNN